VKEKVTSSLGLRGQLQPLLRSLLLGTLGPHHFNKFIKKIRSYVNPPGVRLTQEVQTLKQLTSYSIQPDRKPIIPFDRKHMHICWIIPDFTPGMGGHMTIFRIAHHLESYGHNVSFLLQNPSFHRNGKEASDTINSYFQPFKGQVDLLGTVLPNIEGDALIATDCFSCYPASALTGFRRKFYLVQDYETQFYPMGLKAILAENTYRMGFDCLCAGDWLAHIMKDRFNNWAMSWPLAYDPISYFVDQSEPRSRNRIAFYSRFTTERRAVELGMIALDILHARNIEFHVDFFGYPLEGLRAAYSHADHGILSPRTLGSLYRSAAVGMVFSTTNHSLVNREMMACGLPVVDLDVESVRHIFANDTLVRARPDPEEIANELEHLLKSEERRDTLRSNGMEHVKLLSWDSSSRLVERAIAMRVAETA
jgi:glycosyltransferase involved in cell wall biosynthesis